MTESGSLMQNPSVSFHHHPTKLIIKYDAFCKHNSPKNLHSRPSSCYPLKVCVAAFFADTMLHLQRINSWIRPLSVLTPQRDDDYYWGSIQIHGSSGQTPRIPVPGIQDSGAHTLCHQGHWRSEYIHTQLAWCEQGSSGHVCLLMMWVVLLVITTISCLSGNRTAVIRRSPPPNYWLIFIMTQGIRLKSWQIAENISLQSIWSSYDFIRAL